SYDCQGNRRRPRWTDLVRERRRYRKHVFIHVARSEPSRRDRGYLIFSPFSFGSSGGYLRSSESSVSAILRATSTSRTSSSSAGTRYQGAQLALPLAIASREASVSSLHSSQASGWPTLTSHLSSL